MISSTEGGFIPSARTDLVEKKTPFVRGQKVFSFLGGEQGIRTLETVLAVYTISNRAPSTSSDNSPSVQMNLSVKFHTSLKVPCYYNQLIKKNQGVRLYFLKKEDIQKNPCVILKPSRV